MIAGAVVYFLPFLVVRQENYAQEVYSPVRFLQEAFRQLQTGTVNQQVLLAGGVILLPAVLSLVMGIIGVVGSGRQVVSCLGAVVILGLNLAFCGCLPMLQPEPLNSAQLYQKGYGYWCLPGVGGLAAVCGLAGLLTTPRKRKPKGETSGSISQPKPQASGNVPRRKTPASGPIPQVKTPDPERNASLSGTVSQSGNPVPGFAGQADRSEPEDVTVALEELPETAAAQAPRGVLVGLTGRYRGAEIPFRAGETLKLGRDMSNDVIFEGEPKVSRCHCRITWHPELPGFKLLDQSANGCFANGSEDCLPQNMEIDLEPGTVLAIGDQKNIFRLE